MDDVSKKASSLTKWTRDYACQLNFYRVHLFYFVISSLVSSAIFWASNTDGFHVEYIDALIMCVSAMTNCGLSTIDLSAVNAYQQSILFVLMALGDLSIASISVVYVRRYFFGKKIHELIKRSKATRRMAEDIEQQRDIGQPGKPIESTSASSSGVDQPGRSSDHGKLGLSQSKTLEQIKSPIESVRRRIPLAQSGYGGIPAPWETETFRKFIKPRARKPNQPAADHHYLSFAPKLDNRGRLSNLTGAQLEELGGVEYRALGVLMWLLPAYTMFWLCLGWVILIPYSSKTSIANTIRTTQPGDTNPQWWAFFIGLSAYSNTGLNLLDQNMIPLRHDYLLLIITGAIVLGGNTFYPIFLRLIIWTLSKIVPKHSELHHSLAFLLHHPRRCFLFLFPKKNTWYLFGVQVGIFLLIWAIFEILNIGFSPLEGDIEDPGQLAMDGLYQVTGLRSSGFYITNQSNLSPACQVFFMVNMYISAFPFILSLRSTNIYEERSIGQDNDEDKDPDHSKPGKRNQRSHKGPSVRAHLQNQLAYDMWWLILSVWLITIVERSALTIPAPGYSIFSVIFEVVSAYGTVGLSLGVPYDNVSFCGAWRVLSKLILITVMLRGRHRILPLAIDRAVMIPGQDLMEKIDQEDMLGVHEDKEAHWKKYEELIRKEEQGEQAEHAGKQDPSAAGDRPWDTPSDESDNREERDEATKHGNDDDDDDDNK